MTDKPVRHIDEDGAIYRVDIGLPDADHDPYDVDLVRSTPDRYGLERDQRLTLAQYPSWGEAEEHQRETEDILAEQGVAGLDDAAHEIEQQPYADTDDAQIEDYPERAQQLDVGHFNTQQQAAKYEQDFRGYLNPGTLDGPELAEASAQVEGLPDQWREVDAEGLQAFMAGEPRQMDPADWHPHNPNAEREARIEAEGIYHDPIYDFDL